MNQFSEQCSIEGCIKPRFAKGLCQMHYQRKYRKGITEREYTENVGKTCSYNLCRNPAVIKGMCRKHYNMLRTKQEIDIHEVTPVGEAVD